MDTRARLARHLPAFGLEVRTPRLELRYPDDEDVLALAELAARGVHDSDARPFNVAWTEVPSPHLERNSLLHFWDERTKQLDDDWSLPMVVVVDGSVVGVQAIMAAGWRVRRQVSTGSWLGRSHQGRGIGKEMRAAVLHLGFAGFGAERASTEAWADNPSSIGVTRSLGYRENGVEVLDRSGELAEQHRFVLDRATWERRRRDDIELVGADAVLAAFGDRRLPS